jgi:hypothetical protein
MRPPCSSQGQAPGPRFRGGDEVSFRAFSRRILNAG